MTNLQIAREIAERAMDAQDHDMADAAFRCCRAFKRGFAPAIQDWALVKAFWFDTQDVAA
jgi:hypothetical protein